MCSTSEDSTPSADHVEAMSPSGTTTCPAPELTRELDRVGAAGAAERVDDEVARVAPALDRHLAHQVGHVRLDDPQRAVGGLQ